MYIGFVYIMERKMALVSLCTWRLRQRASVFTDY